MAFFLLTETDLAEQIRHDYPNGNVILREDYQKSFKKKVRWEHTKKFLRGYPTPPPLSGIPVFSDHETGPGYGVLKLFEC